MKQDEAEKLREKLREHVPYEEAVRIRKQLRAFAIENYQQINTDSEHMDFIKRHAYHLSIEQNAVQEVNHTYYYGLFTIITQHIQADTIEELFDKAIAIEKRKATK